MHGRFDITATPLDGLKVLKRKPIGDDRGYLERMFCLDDLSEVLGNRQIAQVNHTLTSRKGTLRGLHFQHPPHGETKIVSCLRGAVFDVAVDLRAGSSTFLHWQGEILSSENHMTLLIPEGFAHGFQTLSDDCEMLYLHTSPYVADAEGGVNATDPRLAIAWPEPIAERSKRDEDHALLTDAFEGLSL